MYQELFMKNQGQVNVNQLENPFNYVTSLHTLIYHSCSYTMAVRDFADTENYYYTNKKVMPIALFYNSTHGKVLYYLYT